MLVDITTSLSLRGIAQQMNADDIIDEAVDDDLNAFIDRNSMADRSTSLLSVDLYRRQLSIHVSQ